MMALDIIQPTNFPAERRDTARLKLLSPQYCCVCRNKNNGTRAISKRNSMDTAITLGNVLWFFLIARGSGYRYRGLCRHPVRNWARI